MFIRFLEYIGSWVLKLLFLVGDMTLLLWEIFKQLPKKLRPKHILQQMSHLGVDTLPIVSLTLLFTGMVMTLQMAGEMIQFGAESTVGGVIAIATGRELGPVLVGVVTAGRVGSAMTAEISTMKVTEQIDALRCMAVNPVGYLAGPDAARSGVRLTPSQTNIWKLPKEIFEKSLILPAVSCISRSTVI